MTDANLKTADSLAALLNDSKIPDSVRRELALEFAEVEALVRKLRNAEIHVAVLGRVSVGKSAVLNALLGRDEFAVNVLHGTTTQANAGNWQEVVAGEVHLIDTPGINELDGEARERLALGVAGRADVVLFVCDGDLTDTELAVLRVSARVGRPMLLVLNKADRFTAEEREALLRQLRTRVEGLIPAAHVLAVAARPASRVVIRLDASGNETESRESPPADVSALRAALTELLEREGKTLAAVNAGLYAGAVSDQLGASLLTAQKTVAERLIRTYAAGKGVAVGLNPVPVADLVAAAGVDIALLLHLSKIYGLPLSKAEAGQLLGAILAQMAVLMGAVWGVHLLSSVLKGLSVGTSTVLTAGIQGGLAYAATYVTGRAADRYLAAGKSWGSGGPKAIVEEILSALDRETLLKEARAEILKRLKSN